MSLKVVESQAEAQRQEPAQASAPWFAGGLVLLGVLAMARVLLGSAWGARLASIGSPGPTLAGSLVAAVLLVAAGLVARMLGGGRLAQLCAGLGVLASPVFWVLFEGWRFPGTLTVALGAVRLEGPLAAALWLIGWVSLVLALVVWVLGVTWLVRGPRRVFVWLAAFWSPLLLLVLGGASAPSAVFEEDLLPRLAVWSWGAAVLSGLGVEILLARAHSRAPLHALMIAFLVQLVLTAAWVVIGYR